MSQNGIEDENTPTEVAKKRRRICYGDGTIPGNNASESKPGNDDYTVGWICAIDTEFLAAQIFLEDDHGQPDHISLLDSNNYKLGRIGRHNVVMATLPDGEYGLVAAATVARNMLCSFPNIRIGLMVGIAGGVPSQKQDIRLGDVVVSSPRDGKIGVLQYDFGKTIQDQTFRRSGFLAPPPSILRTAVTALRAQYEREGNMIDESIGNVLRNERPKVQRKYKRPGPDTDRLYQSRVTHLPVNGASCVQCCSNDAANLVLRPAREDDADHTTIHYGVVASANQLMKDAFIRDKLAEEEGVLCFEMEAAGLMNHFPCLVIRGICDYADSHKNKEWQGYAAMAAAAYAKDLLHLIIPNKVKAEKKISDVSRELRELGEARLHVAQKQLQVQEEAARQKWTAEQEECHQLFRLAKGNRDEDTTYEWYKDRVEDRVEGTCQWFLNHENFQKWQNQDSGPLLVSADPGCGKSVLAKYLIDEILPKSATICYFFFKDQDQNKVYQALCALLHQLFLKRPSLISHAMKAFRANGRQLIYATTSLWTILGDIMQDPQTGPVIFVLDALDECAELEFENLVRNVESQFCSNQSSYPQLKYLLTCRPYKPILSKFRQLSNVFQDIRIPGEDESEAISQEVNRVILHRVNQMSSHLPAQIKSCLEQKLMEITHRTYLWVYLVFDYLENEDFVMTPAGIVSAITTLPRSVNEAYDGILRRSKDYSVARMALSITLTASRPLTLSEMNIALHMNHNLQSMDDVSLEDEVHFQSRLRSCCGLFISIHHGNVYFLHQTAREFLLADSASPKTILPGLDWHGSITTQHAHAVLAEACVLYLNLFNSSNLRISRYANRQDGYTGSPRFFIREKENSNGEADHSIDIYDFLDYSAKYWATHFREAGINDGSTIIPPALRIYDPRSKSFDVWYRVYSEIPSEIPFRRITSLGLASDFGHLAIVKLLVKTGADIDEKGPNGRTPLFRAVCYRHKPVFEFLLEKGADIEVKEVESGLTPLSWAAEHGCEAIVKLLIERGADIEAKDVNGQTPLSLAAANGREAVVKVLLEQGADTEAKDQYKQTPLWWAVSIQCRAIMKLLIEQGADTEAKDQYKQTPLWWTASNAIVKLLIEQGADIEAKDVDGQTPLSLAAAEGREAVVKLLLERGADIEAKDLNGQTPLSLAAVDGHESVVKLLLERGADIEAKDLSGQPPLSLAAAVGRGAVVKRCSRIAPTVKRVIRAVKRRQRPRPWQRIKGTQL